MAAGQAEYAQSLHALPPNRHCLKERRLNWGHQTSPTGLSMYPVPRTSTHHKSINQKLPELWSDFSDRGLPDARSGHCQQTSTFHGDLDRAQAPVSAKSGRVLFVGFVEFDMDGRFQTAGEMDRLAHYAVSSKYPCARPATFDEYSEMAIVGLPPRNMSGRDVVFVGPGGTGCELLHTNTLGAQKCIVHPGDAFDGNWGAAGMWGRKCVVAVYTMDRLKKQQSLASFGYARESVGSTGKIRRSASLTGLSSRTRWTTGDFGGSSSQAQRSIRMDQFFR